MGGCQMTHVEMIYDNNIIIGFRMKGHAGYNTKGPDILCASLSTASQMTINGVLDCTGLDTFDDGECIDEFVRENDPRRAKLWAELEKDFVDELKGTVMLAQIQQLFKSFELYVGQLAEQYSKNVKLERRQKDDM